MEAVPKEIQEARERLRSRMGAANKGAGKGLGRRGKKVVHKNNQEESKMRVTLKNLGCQPIDMISEVNFFPTNDDVYHFTKPQVQVSPMMNTTAVFGTPERAPLSKYMPGILNQLGLASLLNNAALAKGAEEAKPAEDDDVPDLVENFEEVSKDE